MRPAVLAGLVADIRARDDHLDTGILGTKYLLSVLTEAGEVDLAWGVATHRDFPSWGFWLEQGATTLWESWSLDTRSRNHFMFGTIVDWIFGSLAGIRIDAPGGRRLGIRPCYPRGLDRLRVETEIGGQPVMAAWRRDGDDVELTAEIGGGVHADVTAPDGICHTITDAGRVRFVGSPVHSQRSES